MVLLGLISPNLFVIVKFSAQLRFIANLAKQTGSTMFCGKPYLVYPGQLIVRMPGKLQLGKWSLERGPPVLGTHTEPG